VPAIATLRPGQPVQGVYACTRKDRMMARSGTPYLAIELRDRTGTLPAKIFRDVDLVAGRFDRGDLVEVTGRVERFREELQLEIATIARATGEAADPTTFLPTTFRDMEELDGFLEHLAREEVHERGYRALLDALLDDEPLREQWRRAPCTRGGHHAYLGGLLEHTVAVGRLAVETCALHVRLDSDLLITAALVHDLGKIGEFTYGAEIGLTEEGRLLGHVELGMRLVDERARQVGVETERRLQLAHCILTHHGPDRAPGRRFASAEALALARINTLDATIKGALEHGLPTG